MGTGTEDCQEVKELTEAKSWVAAACELGAGVRLSRVRGVVMLEVVSLDGFYDVLDSMRFHTDSALSY